MSTSVNPASNPGVEMQLLTDGFDIFDVTPDPNNLMAAAPRTTDKGSVSVFMMFKYATWIEIIFNIIGVVISLCDGVLYPLIAILIGDVFDSKAFNPLAYDVAEIENLCNKTSLKFMYIGIGLFFTSLIRTIIFDVTGGNQIRRIRRLYIKSLLDQEMGWYDAHNSGEMTSRMSGDIFLLHDAIGQKVGEFFSYFGMCITGYVIGFVKEWKLCFVMISVAPFMVGAAGIFAFVQTRTASSTQASYSVAGGIASETISNMRTVAALGIEKSRIHQYLQTLRHSLHVGIRASHETGGSTGLLFFFVFCAFWIGYIYGAKKIQKRDMSASKLAIVVFSVLCGTLGLSQIATPIGSIFKGTSSAYRIFKTIERVPKIKNEGKRHISEIKEGNIVFEGVSFCYPTRPDMLILNNFNLEIKAGHSVGLVGASGCGKSTIIGLLQRLYEPVDGKIMIDGIDIREFDLYEYRSMFGVVGQEPSLFAISIKENIALGAHRNILAPHYHDTSDPQDCLLMPELEEKIMKCAHIANATNFINSLPQKFDTVLGQRGAQISGGQKQRISIARALMNDPKLLILDEATSALDFKSEKIVQRALDKAAAGRTSVIIAHRLSTIRDAHRILVFDHGQVVEDGNYTTLMEKQGLFYKLVKNQEMGKKQQEKFDNDEDLEEDVVPEQNEVDKTYIEVDDDHRTNWQKFSAHFLVFGRVFRLNLKEVPWMILGFIGSMIYGALFPIFAYFLAEAICMLVTVYLTGMSDDSEIMKYFYIFLGISGAMFISTYLHKAFFMMSGEFLTYRVRKLSFYAICRQDIGWFDKKENSTGRLAGRLAADATKLNGVTGNLIGTMIHCSFSLIIGLILGYITNVKISWVSTIFVPLIVFNTYIQLRISVGFAGPETKIYANAENLMTEVVENIKTIKMLAKEDYFKEKYCSYLVKPSKRAPFTAIINGLVLGWVHAFIFWKYSVLMYVAGQELKKDPSQMPDIMKALCSIIFGAMSVGFAATYMADFGNAKVAAESIFKIIDRKSPQDPFSNEGEKNFTIDQVELDDIKFRYPTRPEQVILDGASFVIPKGKSVALVGPSGCGKSTVIQLIERFYKPERGTVKINGRNIQEFNLATLRNKIGYVGQEPLLFAGTIGENIVSGMCGSWTDDQLENGGNLVAENMDKIVAAAKMANCHNFICQLPQGYNTIIGERGTSLSGGQKQRIAIARALITQPELLILDEATSALDSESEMIVQQAIDKIAKQVTSIVIAHRLSTVKDSDIIVVLSGGKVVEQGTHDELMKEEGVYFHLVQIQAQ
ncbi:multidrug resistance protein, putative [Entamoeba dispar SAW760]|uniref:Multidrug resistance protein, putative n=1 Tax=Entamoeba dispar (strain ATCC PRA-260 / SAW760) TaxID=370354 RepID=B0ET85_ENTDS|nr:multidrug resistance protein, putative [Entamoeba dispar SAW760]EDR22245.1 multidrug resistance protein, putative [Entamoeba dispar SAW760]|eukprot:EDR22245.1 multidrug resistance protein, putative [Entamoeba dispar SAW760]